MIQCCLNGDRMPGQHPAVPVTAAEIARVATAAVAAGATDLHVHPKTGDGHDTLNPDTVAVVLDAVRSAVPGVPVGVTTGAWTEPNPVRRAALIAAWPVVPDHASVNWHEPGAELVARAVLDRGIGVEAGLFSGTAAVDALRASGLAPRMLRLLAEVVDDHAERARYVAEELLESVSALCRPVLLHGTDRGAWPVLRLALQRGVDTRVGLEDTLVGLDDEPAADNAALVRQAVVLRDGSA